MRRLSFRMCIPIALTAMVLLYQPDPGSWAAPWQDQLRQTVPTRTPEVAGATVQPPPAATPVPPAVPVQTPSTARTEPTATQTRSEPLALEQTPNPIHGAQTATAAAWATYTQTPAHWTTVVHMPPPPPATRAVPVQMLANLMSTTPPSPSPALAENSVTVPTGWHTSSARADSSDKPSSLALPLTAPPVGLDPVSPRAPSTDETPWAASIAGYAGTALLGALLLSGAAALIVLVRLEKRRGGRTS